MSVNSPIALIKNEGEGSELKKVKKENIQNKLSDNNNNEIKSLKTSKDKKKLFTRFNKKLEKSRNKFNSFTFSKKIAKDNDLDIKNIQGSGPKGRVIKRDFDNVISKKDNLSTSSSIKEIVEASSMRKIIADRTTLTKKIQFLIFTLKLSQM